LLIGALLAGVIPIAQAQTGLSATEAIPIGTDGKFAGSVGPFQSPTQNLWFKFNYVGGGTTVTATLNFEPPDSNRLDFFLFTGDPSNPTQVGGTSTLSGNTRTLTYSDPGGPRTVFIKVENDHPDRSVSFVGALTPTATLATPTATSATSPATPQVTPTAGPVAANPTSAITLSATSKGLFSGTLSPNQAVWYRLWYGSPGVETTVSVSVAPTADSVDLNLYTGTDPANLGAGQGGTPTRSGNTLSRRVNLPNSQFVYFSVGNNSSAVIAYGGSVDPFAAPPGPTATPTAATAVTPTAVPVQAPPVPHDAQYYSQTGFRIDDQALPYFQAKGQVKTFGYPVSRLFTFLGCPVQMFQRLIVQLCPGQGPALINLLDPEIFPYTRVNGSVFPSPDDSLKKRTPAVGSPEYANILQFIQSVTPDRWPDANGQAVNFWQTFQDIGGLDVAGAPISTPQADPTNNSFIYMRFQRVILHFHPTTTGGTVTEPLLLADYLKQIMIGPGAPNLPPDLQQQASSSQRYFAQYCRSGTRWICRPGDLPGSDLTFAFEQG
jgi:hypothetical protein